MRCSERGGKMVYNKPGVFGPLRKGGQMAMLGGIGFLFGGPLGALIGSGVGGLIAGKGYWKCKSCGNIRPAAAWHDTDS